MTEHKRRLTHPILRLSVVEPSGERSYDHRVFCRFRQESVPVGVCCACARCDAITDGEVPTVHCTVPRVETDDASVGAMLARGTTAVANRCTLEEALSVMRTSGARSLAVVDPTHTLVGVVHELMLVHSGHVVPVPARGGVSAAMSSALAVHERTPVRTALRLLATTHSREATVVTDEGAPLGTFRDVDGMRFVSPSSRPAGR